ncbi:hypothetical protein DFP72DRAFT_1041809 [Ephemerocybe angulata]|uniref:Uncharacterized protein n=1 Tax=Ephemerocybe angulata TaxID=980116 RepID=A0A8H6ICA5_9AGAR|nr:hypothetical protein DFP72DRAFT_1041809 [Tulosesus angulatus]
MSIGVVEGAKQRQKGVLTTDSGCFDNGGPVDRTSDPDLGLRFRYTRYSGGLSGRQSAHKLKRLGSTRGNKRRLELLSGREADPQRLSSTIHRSGGLEGQHNRFVALAVVGIYLVEALLQDT